MINDITTHVVAVYIDRKKISKQNYLSINSWNMIYCELIFMKIKIKARALLEGRWYTGKKLHQIWAEWAVHASCYLQKGLSFYLYFHKNQLNRGHI